MIEIHSLPPRPDTVSLTDSFDRFINGGALHHNARLAGAMVAGMLFDNLEGSDESRGEAAQKIVDALITDQRPTEDTDKNAMLMQDFQLGVDSFLGPVSPQHAQAVEDRRQAIKEWEARNAEIEATMAEERNHV